MDVDMDMKITDITDIRDNLKDNKNNMHISP
jgi:hypothetical protein